MNGWTRDPMQWLRGTELGEFGDSDDNGIFHVTTQRDALKASGALKARRDLGGVIALGGGSANEAKDKVSFTFQWSRAMWLHGGIRTAALAARNEIGIMDLIQAMFEWTGFPDDPPWGPTIDGIVQDEDETGLGNLQDWMEHLHDMFMPAVDEVPDLSVLPAIAWLRLISKHESMLRLRYRSGEQKYRLIQDFEAYISDRFGGTGDDDSCVPVIGFTAKWEKFAKIAPSQIGVVQVEVRDGADVELVPNECELRFRPEDVRIVEYNVEDGPAPILDEE